MEKKEIVLHATAWVNLERIMLSGVNQTEKDKYGMISYMWNLKKPSSQR